MNDANFSGNRLRLTAFLRVVGNVPLRPSRLRRRIQHFEPHTEESHQLITEDIHRNDATVDLNASKSVSDGSQDTTTSQEGGNDNSITIAPTDVYEIPRSPTQEAPLLTPSDKHSIELNGSDRNVTGRNAAPSSRNEQTGSKFAVMRTSRPIETSASAAKSSGSRKRRLPPVNALALLRTSTSDGLPEPSAAERAFAAPITEIDPIMDSQVFQARGRVESTPHTSTPRVPTSKKSRVGQQPQTSILRQYNTLVPRKPTHILEHQNRIDFFPADGFERDELGIVSSTKPRRRRTVAPRERKRPTGAASLITGLALTSGLLPPPVLQRDLTLFSTMRPPHGSSHFDNTTSPGQLTLARSENPANNSTQVKVRSQLSSITAPVRRDSESSASEAADETGSADGEDEDEDAFSRNPTFVEDSSYFENAMYHLDVGEAAEVTDVDTRTRCIAMT